MKYHCIISLSVIHEVLRAANAVLMEIKISKIQIYHLGISIILTSFQLNWIKISFSLNFF